MREVREIHDLTGRVAAHYMEKYGAEACNILEDAARQCEKKSDLRGRNRLLRLRDEILIAGMQDAD
tara:strand:- start:876 stop:1073 length:198 start_codon:yes stop_codon:yes gene_type:complete